MNMKELIKKLLKESLTEITKIKPENEIFSAYNGRYLFDIDVIYNLIDSNQIPFIVHKYPPSSLRGFSSKDFAFINPKKLEKLKKTLNLDKPLGIFAKIINPEDKTHTGEWTLIDGNHRVSAAAELEKSGDLYVIDMTKLKQKDINKFMFFNKKVPHQLFQDDDIE